MKHKIKLRGTENGDVWLDGEKLDPKPSQEFINHSPDGFSWGYHGSGCAQLALAICMKLYPKAKASRVYQKFKDQYIAGLPFGEPFDKTIDISVFAEQMKNDNWQKITP